jgi:GTPase SAR1 family protein
MCEGAFQPNHQKMNGVDMTFRVVRIEYQSPEMTNNAKKIIRTRIFSYHEDLSSLLSSQDHLLGRRLRTMEGIFLCFDVCNRESFEHLQQWLKMLKHSTLSSEEKKSEIINEDTLAKQEQPLGVPKVPIIIFGLKADLRNSKEVNPVNSSQENKRQVSFEETQAFCAALGIKYRECSSKDNIGIDDTLFEMVHDVIHSAPEYHQELTKVLTEEERQRQQIEFERNSRGHTVCRIW